MLFCILLLKIDVHNSDSARGSLLVTTNAVFSCRHVLILLNHTYAVYLCTLCEILVLLVYMLFIYVYGVRIGIVMSYMLFFNVYRV